MPLYCPSSSNRGIPVDAVSREPRRSGASSVLLSSAIRRGWFPIPINGKSCLSKFFTRWATAIPSVYAILYPSWILATTCSRVRKHTTAVAPTAASSGQPSSDDRIPSANGKSTSGAKSTATTCSWRPSGQRLSATTNAHGPPSSRRIGCAWCS
jgi:hypothetical protein